MKNSTVQELRKEYVESLQGWKETLNPVQEHFAQVTKKHWHGTKYISRNLPFQGEKLVICPPYSALNMAANQQHRTDYATGIFEGSSAEPIFDQNNNLVAINVILHAARMARFGRSLKARNYDLHMPLEKFGQALLDIVAIHGRDIVTNEDGSPARAYIRPSAGPGVGAWGVSFKPGYFIETSNLAFRWGPYFPDSKRIYYETGAKVVLTGTRRTFPITGKHASNYGSAAVEGAMARSMHYDEMLFLAPYGVKNQELDYGMIAFDDLMRYGALADGPGEEVFGILKDGATLVYPPMRVNRLGGTVLDYVVKYLAPALGIATREQDITLEQIRSGKIVGLGFAGNAVKITPIGVIDVVKTEHKQVQKVETLANFGIHPAIAKIRDQYCDEVSGKKKPSHDSLLTPVDLAWGKGFRAYLDEFWGKLGF